MLLMCLGASVQADLKSAGLNVNKPTGEGGFGAVHEVLLPEFGKVAVKLLRVSSRKALLPSSELLLYHQAGFLFTRPLPHLTFSFLPLLLLCRTRRRRQRTVFHACRVPLVRFFSSFLAPFAVR